MYRPISLLRIIFCVYVTLTLYGCGTKVFLSDFPTTYVPADFDRLVEIKNWIAIGPFEIDTL